MGDPQPFLITTKTTPEEIGELYKTINSSQVFFEIDSGIKKEDLHRIMNRFRNEAFYRELLLPIILHPATDDETLDHILSSEDEDDIEVLNTIATSGKSSKKILRQLSKSSITSVREHATLGLIQLELQTASPDEFREIVKNYSGETGIDIGVRLSVVNHPRTPLDVLRALEDDEVDIVSNLARKRMQTHS